MLGVATSNGHTFKHCNFSYLGNSKIYIPFKGTEGYQYKNKIIFPVIYAISGDGIGISVISIFNYTVAFQEYEVLNLVSGKALTLDLSDVNAPYFTVTNPDANTNTSVIIPWVSYGGYAPHLQTFYNMDFHT